MNIKKLTVIFAISLTVLSMTAQNKPLDTSFDNLPVKVILFPYRIAVISSTVDGVVKKHNFREGKKFKKNEILTELIATEYREKLAKAQAAHEELKKNYDFLQDLYKATLGLSKKGMFSKMELQKNKVDADIALSRIKSAQAEKNLAQHNLESCSIKAPFSGRVEEIIIQEHEFVRPGEKMISIIDDNRLLAIMHLPEKYNSKIKIGQVLSFSIPQNKKIYKGKVFEKAARINHRSRTFQVKLILDNSKGELTAGMSGILVDKILPEKAVQTN